MPLSKEQLSAVYDKINAGDKEAMKFIVDYPSMSDEEANKYLTKIAMQSSEGKDASNGSMGDMIAFLIKDENEAINGYDKAILLAQSVSCEKSLATFQSIKQDELRHIQMLKDLQTSLSEKKGE